MKPIREVVSFERLESLPTTDSLQANFERIEHLENFGTMLDFHNANIPLNELSDLLKSCGDMIYNGTKRSIYDNKIKVIKPSTTVVVAEDFI